MADHITEFTSCNIWLRVGGEFQPLIWGLVAPSHHSLATKLASVSADLPKSFLTVQFFLSRLADYRRLVFSCRNYIFCRSFQHQINKCPNYTFWCFFFSPRRGGQQVAEMKLEWDSNFSEINWTGDRSSVCGMWFETSPCHRRKKSGAFSGRIRHMCFSDSVQSVHVV